MTLLYACLSRNVCSVSANIFYQSSNGPPLIFDHQMVMDSEAQMLYVFGGRVVDGDWERVKYSGLYSYSVQTDKWRLLQYVPSAPFLSPVLTLLSRHPDNVNHTSVPPRYGIFYAYIIAILPINPTVSGHSMVLEPRSRKLYIFAGQANDKYLSDMYVYDIATNTASEVFSNFTSAGGPDACFTQRAVIDPMLQEIYVYVHNLTRWQHH